MTTTPGDRLLGPLLDALLAARTQPSAEAFDAVVEAAVTAGTLTPDLARELRYWQRASVHEVTDHVRTVLPVVLPSALAAVTSAADDAAVGAASARELWTSRPDESPATSGVHTEADAPAPADAVLSAPDVIVLPDDSGPAEVAGVDVDEVDEERSRHHARRTLFVAGLTSTA